jgi:hypothetical protein
MARHPPQSHIALFDHAWLVIVLFGALSGCGTNSVATNSVNVRAENLNAPTVGRARALATVSATSIEEISVPGPSPSEPVTAKMTIRPKSSMVGETLEVLVLNRKTE